MIELPCSVCGKLLRVKADASGRLIRCPNCGEVSRTAASDSPPPKQPELHTPQAEKQFSGKIAILSAIPVVLICVAVVLFFLKREDGDYRRGKQALEARDYELAVRCFDDVIRRDARHADAYAGRASAYLLLREYNKAIRDASEAIRLNPEKTDAFETRSIAFMGAGDYAAAAKDKTVVITHNPNNADLFYDRGMLYHSLLQMAEGAGDVKEVSRLRSLMRADFNEAARLDPDRHRDTPNLFR